VSAPRLSTLTDVCESIRYGYTASASTDAVGPRFLRITDIVPEALIWETVPYCEIDERDKERYSLAVGDIVVARTGATVGYAKLIRDDVDAIFASYLVRFRVDPKKADIGYVGRLVESNVYKSFVKSRIGGAAQPNASAQVLGSFEFALPSRPSQARIVQILSTYDDLIENNRRRMALLEDSARQLYQEWFVRLRFPGHEHSRITDGVPEGWERTQILKLINVKHGYAFQGAYFSDDPTSRVLMTPGNFAIGGGLKTDKLKYYAEEIPLDPAYVLEPMDLVLTMTDLSKDSDTLGYPAIIPHINGQAFLHNQRIGKVVPKTDFFPRFFLYCLFCNLPYRHHVVGSASGTSVKHTSPARILAYSVAIPTNVKLITYFDELIEPFFRQINCLIGGNQKLRAARVLLLPRLMSGEVAV
jgi:type I restriction enzyme S subunit